MRQYIVVSLFRLEVSMWRVEFWTESLADPRKRFKINWKSAFAPSFVFANTSSCVYFVTILKWEHTHWTGLKTCALMIRCFGVGLCVYKYQTHAQALMDCVQLFRNVHTYAKLLQLAFLLRSGAARLPNNCANKQLRSRWYSPDARA